MGHSLEAWLQLIVVEGQSTDRERGHRSAQQKAQETGSTTVSIASDLPTLKNPRPEGRLGLDILCQGSA